MTPAGFPHSDIHGSLPAFGYPWLFVDRYVLLRLPVPRHPPCALLSLTCQQLLLLVFSIMLESLFFGFSFFSLLHLAVQCKSVIFCFAFLASHSICFFFIQFSRYRRLRGAFRVHGTLLCFARYVHPFARLSALPVPFRFVVVTGRNETGASRWWAQVDSNHRPHAYQACALTT